MILTDNDILKYVKIKLRVPFQKLEISDEDLLYVIKEDVLPVYSDYEPLAKEFYLDINKSEYKVEGHSNLFRIPIEDGDPIRSVIELVFKNDVILYGHPVTGVFTYDHLPEWFLRSYKARTAAIWGYSNKTFEFRHPNLIKIYNIASNDNCLIRYVCNHTKFETIYTKRTSLIKDMALASAMMYVGSIRQRFQSINTPFGDIQLNGEQLVSDGRDLWDKSIEKLKLIPPAFFFTDIENQ